MGIADQIFDDLKQAMRDRNAARVTALRFVRSEIQKTEKERQRPLEDPEVVDNLARQSRRLKESIFAFTKVGRDDLAAKEAAELELVRSYMPRQLGADAIAELAAEIIAQVGAETQTDVGKVMGPLMERLRGQADGALCSQVVRELLDS